jgi:hypothetical protein
MLLPHRSCARSAVSVIGDSFGTLSGFAEETLLRPFVLAGLYPERFGLRVPKTTFLNLKSGREGLSGVRA